MDEQPKQEQISFFNHMFNFDENSKKELSNIAQYSLLAIIPVIGLNKLMKKYIPPVDEDKGSLEILFEIVLQVLILFYGLFFIHRFIIYFPSYSGENYSELSIVSIVLAILLITLSIQSKLGEKANILVDRLHELWSGETTISNNTNSKNNPKKKEVAKPSVERQPSPNYHIPQTQPQHPQQQQQELPNYNLMYHNTNIPPHEETNLLAANEALGGSSFGSMY